MSKVLFIARYSLHKRDNLKAKFDGQIKALNNIGYEVHYMAYDNKYFYVVHNDQKQPLLRLFWVNSSLFYHIFAYIFMYRAAIIALRKGDWRQDDIAYIRSSPKEFYWRKMKRQLFRKKMKTIVEIPTYIINGGEKPKLYIRLLHNLLCIFGEDRYTTFYTVIGDDVNGSYNGTPAINIDNGVDVQLFGPRTRVPHLGFNLVAVGNMAEWHGFDRVIEGLALYNERDDINFYVVGPDGDGSLAKWKQLVQEKSLHSKVHFCGPLFGEDLLKLLNKCDVAFASLGMYRTGCFNASVLKAREYMSRGIPFIYACNDPVLDQHPSPYALKVENSSTPIDIKHVVEFCEKTSSIQDIVPMMRQYAELYMTWDSQFRKVFSWYNKE